jgi:Polyketide cyclase / dehydrase and lipid transport
VAPSTLRSACAADVKTLRVFRDQDTYHIIFDAIVDAPAHKVYRLLSDYAHLDRLSPTIIAITVQPTPQGTGERVRSVLRSCVLVFCREVVEVEDVTQSDGKTIAAEIVPGEGDFQGGYTLWRIQAAGSRTRLHYEATRTPAFWVPRLVGSQMIEATMRNQFAASVARLERAINERAAGRRKRASQIREAGNIIRTSRGV